MQTNGLGTPDSTPEDGKAKIRGAIEEMETPQKNGDLNRFQSWIRHDLGI